MKRETLTTKSGGVPTERRDIATETEGKRRATIRRRSVALKRIFRNTKNRSNEKEISAGTPPEENKREREDFKNFQL